MNITSIISDGQIPKDAKPIDTRRSTPTTEQQLRAIDTARKRLTKLAHEIRRNKTTLTLITIESRPTVRLHNAPNNN